MDWHAISGDEALTRLQSNATRGLRTQQVHRLLAQYGENKLADKKPASILRQFLAQFADFMVVILLIASVISFATTVLEGSGDYLDPIIILLIVLLNAIIGVVQERKAERSLEALKQMAAPSAQVLRDGRKVKIPASQVVPGDILYVHTGDMVAADARLLEATGLRLQESALTGESAAVAKDPGRLLAKSSAPADQKNMLFSSTNVVAGHGIAVVTQTGMDTQVGKIAHLLNAEESPQTPLQLRLAKVGKVLGLVALGICALIFAMGLLRRADIMNSFMLSVSLAVAAIPEGLPAIVTVVLSLGVQRMAKSNAIVRHLPAVETLGSATVICSDKTGTLTQNRMTVTEIYTPEGRNANKQERENILKIGALCNNSSMSGKGKQRRAQGEPTENAILNAAAAELSLIELQQQYPRVSENPFTSERKCMSTLHKQSDGYLLAVKGAPDVLLHICNRVLVSGHVMELTQQRQQQIRRQNEQMAAQALRVLAVAYRDASSVNDTAEGNLIFCGLLGMQDPPRAEVFSAVLTCKEAGIIPVMITGDHAVTACAIARQLGILRQGELCITGQELDHLTQEDLVKKVMRCRVFARVTPEHKVRIVKAFRTNGEIVAMTGDGVNDSPALKAADIGCAMGKSGTEVAKNAADMVLTDDNFATIVKAIAQGRGIYDNIKKAVHFLLSCNIGEILTIFFASLLGMPSPLLPIQLLWVNLVTDSLPAMALGTERMEKDIMQRKPLPPNSSFFSGGMGLDICLEGLMVGALALFAFLFGWHRYATLEHGRTMCFAVLSLCELVHAINMRSSHSIFRTGLFGNRKLTLSIIVCIVMQVAVITVPALNPVFDTVPLYAEQWFFVAALSIVPLFAMECGKALDSVRKHTKSRDGKLQTEKGRSSKSRIG